MRLVEVLLQLERPGLMRVLPRLLTHVPEFGSPSINPTDSRSLLQNNTPPCLNLSLPLDSPPKFLCNHGPTMLTPNHLMVWSSQSHNIFLVWYHGPDENKAELGTKFSLQKDPSDMKDHQAARVKFPKIQIGHV
ncbi:hypothetical protein V6N13_036378 [Hibiscus sabdariffa]|uniref:Uncharacterized protein n=2 Tax=Hibiscus sabdariffa TaxID=183260 RepID=A0ABR2AQR4_9ROSI